MSVNITVNGKFTKQTILDDPERTKRELENKRRTLRLQQVRAQSKELARKIRNDVSQEKEKQLRNLEAIKAQELDCWREHVLAQKCHDYQKSIKEVGRAHKAAKAENDAKKNLKNDASSSTSKFTQKTKDFRKKSDITSKVGESKDNEKHTSDTTTGKRVQVCFDENLQHCSCPNLSDSENDEKYDIDFTCSSLSSTSSLDYYENTETRCTQTDAPAPNSNTMISKINVAVDTATLPVVDDDDDKPLETKKLDKDTQLSPKKLAACTQTSINNATETSKNDVLSTSSSEVIETRVPQRYTQISDLIAKQLQIEINQQVTLPASQLNLVVAEKNVNSESTTKRSSPTKSPKSIHSRLLLAPKSSAVTILTPGTTERIASGSDSSSRVQYYDYRNKYSREYVFPVAKAVPQTNKNEPNAMQRASLEKSLQKKREEELQKLRRKSNERCQRALEREQVRRECVELTEKLEALTQNQQNLLPTDANLHNHQYYAIKTARKESKLNGAIEELLSRPAIITCPEVRNEKFQNSHNADSNSKFPMHADPGDLNLGATRTRRISEPVKNNESLSSDSSGSILLGYIDDQRNNIRKEITQCEANPTTSQEKVEKLQKLLERIEGLRCSLLKEIDKNEAEEEIETEKIKQGTKVRKSSNFKANKNCESQTTEKNEKLAQIGSKAEIKIVTSDNQIIEYPQPGQPLEIVIKVKSEKSAKKSAKVKMGKSTVTKQIRTEFKKSTKIISNIPAEHTNDAGTASRPAINRRNSYDSNSTAYRSLPPALTNTSEQFVKRMSQVPKPYENNEPNETDSSTVKSTSNASTGQAMVECSQRQPRAHLNPLIAQYIQRLLVMSRDSVNALEVSSSDVETPGSSVINITANMPSADSGDSLLLSEDHIQRVERFISDNRSFINELEESFRTHSNSSLEKSLRRLEEAWKQKLINVDKRKSTDNVVPACSSSLKPNGKLKPKATNSTIAPQQKPTAKRLKSRDSNTNANNKKEKGERTQSKVTPLNDQPSADNELFAKSQTQLQHYAELTKNCSTRIAELTDLITKVRAEKQRLLEITLTSVSDNERPSTEYRDLPAASKVNNTQQQIDAATASGSSLGSPAETNQNIREADNAAALPLEKHKKTGQSRDSGISMQSRPVTAMGNDNEAEPQSFVSSESITTTTQTSSVHRKSRPPPALTTQSRYSPQAEEDEVVHELSTIVEVDTPATSRLNTSMPVHHSSQQSAQQQALKKINADKEALKFPTFEEYVRTNNLDLTILDHEQSLLMEQEYNELIEALKNGQGDEVINYDAFPTLSAYLQNLTTNDENYHTPETLDDLFDCLRLTPVTAQPFPSHQEYFGQKKSYSPEAGYVDTDSLENAASGGASGYTETESETIDIESELRRRNILKGSFRSLSTRREVISSTGHGKNSEHLKFSAHSTAIEVNDTGTERQNSSVSDSASEKFQQELRALGLQWPQTMRKKEKQAAALSNSSSSEVTTSMLNDKSKRAQKSPRKLIKSTTELQSDSESSDRPLNLRDFLTRQLLKHAAATSSADSSLSGDSLRSQFFLAVLDSMTPPSGSPRANTNTNTNATNRNERQKTSTPVPSPSDCASPSNSTQLFSNESHISAVPPHVSSASTRNVRSSKDKSKRRDT